MSATGERESKALSVSRSARRTACITGANGRQMFCSRLAKVPITVVLPGTKMTVRTRQVLIDITGIVKAHLGLLTGRLLLIYYKS